MIAARCFKYQVSTWIDIMTGVPQGSKLGFFSRSICQEVFCEKHVLKNFLKFEFY